MILLRKHPQRLIICDSEFKTLAQPLSILQICLNKDSQKCVRLSDFVVEVILSGIKLESLTLGDPSISCISTWNICRNDKIINLLNFFTLFVALGVLSNLIFASPSSPSFKNEMAGSFYILLTKIKLKIPNIY